MGSAPRRRNLIRDLSRAEPGPALRLADIPVCDRDLVLAAAPGGTTIGSRKAAAGTPTGRGRSVRGQFGAINQLSLRFTTGRAAPPHVALRNGQAWKFGMTEQSRQPSGVHENSAVFALDASAGDARDQAGQSTCRIGGVEEDALGAGGQPHRLPRGRSQRGIADADLAVVELQVRGRHDCRLPTPDAAHREHGDRCHLPLVASGSGADKPCLRH